MSDRANTTETAFWEDATDTEARKRYQMLVNTINDGIYQLDVEGRVVAVNDVIVELTGYTREELLGEHISVLLGDADVSAIEREIDRLRTDATERSELLYLTIQTAAGERINCELRVNLFEADDTVRGTVGTVREITDRQRSDQTISEREKELEALSAAMEESIDGLAILDENAEYVFVNQAHADIYGYDDPAALLGETWRLCYDDEGIDRLEAEAMPALSAEGSWRGEATGLRKDGTTFSQELSLTVLDDGRYVCVIRDVSDHRRMADELQTTKEKYQRLVEQNLVGIYIIQNGEVKYVNSRFAEIFGYAPEEMVGTPAAEFVAEHERDRITEMFRECEQGDENLRYEVTGTRKDGDSVEVEAHSGPIEYEGGPAIMGTLIDISERKDRERELRETTEQLEVATSAADVGLWQWDIQDNVVTADEVLAETYGVDPGEAAAGTPMEAFYEPIHQDDEDETWDQLMHAVEETGELEAEYRVIDGDGETRWVLARGEVEYDDGEPLWMNGAITDITDRKEAQEALREREQYLSTLVETVPECIKVVDADGTLLQMNPAGLGIVQADSESAVVGSCVYDLIAPEDRQRFREFNEQICQGDSGTLEFDIVGLDGDRRHMESHAAPLARPDGTTSQLALTRDITEQVERERYLNDAKAQLEAAIEAGAVGTWEWHIPEDRFVTGPSFARTFGIDPDAARDGVPLERLVSSIHEADRERVEARIEDAVESCGEYEEEYRVWNADDELRWVVARGHVECDEDGKPVTFPGALTDITERKQFEQQLEESNERLEQFAYAASHDLQEPLRMVTSYLQMIERRYSDELDEDGQEFIDFAVDGAERMRDMIEGLLEYSRVDTRGDPFEPVDLNDVLADVRDDLQVRIEESDADIAADSLPRIDGDEGQLRQVFQNLLDNAIAYSGDEPPEVSISADQDGAEWVISVSDDGVGIDPDDDERVFEVFQSLHGKEHGGTGIGLALCERIVERHGGDIWVESEPGEGATFSFTMPAEGKHSE